MTSDGFTEKERTAIKDRAAELRTAASRTGEDKAAAERQDVLDTIAKMPQPDREIAEGIHTIVTREAPELAPKLWYGMPAYYTRGGKVLCFFMSADKDSARYSSLGFNEEATLDDGTMWPTTFALTELTTAHEATITKLIKKATDRNPVAAGGEHKGAR